MDVRLRETFAFEAFGQLDRQEQQRLASEGRRDVTHSEQMIQRPAVGWALRRCGDADTPTGTRVIVATRGTDAVQDLVPWPRRPADRMIVA